MTLTLFREDTGIFSLDLSKPIKLEAHTDDASEFFAQIKEFIVD